MTHVASFHSINESKKPAEKRVHHDNNACAPGRDIPQNERKSGDGGYPLCHICEEENRKKH
jgi:hypothetical protein